VFVLALARNLTPPLCVQAEAQANRKRAEVRQAAERDQARKRVDKLLRATTQQGIKYAPHHGTAPSKEGQGYSMMVERLRRAQSLIQGHLDREATVLRIKATLPQAVPFQSHFNPISIPFQPHFNPISIPL
jgi:hypothetical protein